jgi:hypothetical protein
MQLIMIFINNNALHVSGVSRPSSGARDCAAYGTGMLIYAVIGNTYL